MKLKTDAFFDSQSYYALYQVTLKFQNVERPLKTENSLFRPELGVRLAIGVEEKVSSDSLFLTGRFLFLC